MARAGPSRWSAVDGATWDGRERQALDLHRAAEALQAAVDGVGLARPGDVADVPVAELREAPTATRMPASSSTATPGTSQGMRRLTSTNGSR